MKINLIDKNDKNKVFMPIKHQSRFGLYYKMFAEIHTQMAFDVCSAYNMTGPVNLLYANWAEDLISKKSDAFTKVKLIPDQGAYYLWKHHSSYDLLMLLHYKMSKLHDEDMQAGAT